MAATDADDVIYQFRIDLADAKPPIWRRVQVPASTELHSFHAVIQRVMEWEFDHLYEFRMDGEPIEDLGEPRIPIVAFDEYADREEIILAELRLKPGDTFEYIYDFGDYWVHEIKLEEVLDRDPDVDYPICVKAVKAAPPEDSGGMRSYYGKLAAIEDPDHPEHHRETKWLGDWDPDTVDLDEINERLKQMKL